MTSLIVSDWSSNVTFKTLQSTLPVLPVPVLYVGLITPTTIALSWSTITNAVEYSIEYRVQGQTTWSTQATTSTSIALSALNADTTYEIRMRAIGDEIAYTSSPYTAIVTGTTLPLPQLTTPTLTAGTVTPTSVQVLWVDVPNATTYKIEYRLYGSSVWHPVIDPVSPQNVTGLTPNTAYQFRITAIGNEISYVDSDPSLPITVTTEVEPPLPAPTLTVTSYGAHRATFAVTLVPQATQWQLRYRATPDGAWTVVTVTQGATYQVQGLRPETEYEFQAKAIAPNNQSEWSSSVVITMLTPGPIPIILHLAADRTWIRVEIEHDAAITHFAVQWRKKGTTTWTKSPVVPVSEYTITGLQPATYYDVRVASVIP